MIEAGYTSWIGKMGHTAYHCSCCHNCLGEIFFKNGVEYSEFQGWQFCPFCAEPLYDESEV